MANIGLPELIIIAVIVLLIFGGNRLSKVGEGLGKGIRNFKRGLSGADEIDVTPEPKQVSDQSGGEHELSDAQINQEHKQG